MSEMADATLEQLGAAAGGRFAPRRSASSLRWPSCRRAGRRCRRARPVVESLVSREGRHLFVYPFAGRLVHVGHRLAHAVGRTRAVAGEAGLLEDVLAPLNAGELKQRRFREIARVAGLTFQVGSRGVRGAGAGTRTRPAARAVEHRKTGRAHRAAGAATRAARRRRVAKKKRDDPCTWQSARCARAAPVRRVPPHYLHNISAVLSGVTQHFVWSAACVAGSPCMKNAVFPLKTGRALLIHANFPSQNACFLCRFA